MQLQYYIHKYTYLMQGSLTDLMVNLLLGSRFTAWFSLPPPTSAYSGPPLSSGEESDDPLLLLAAAEDLDDISFHLTRSFVCGGSSRLLIYLFPQCRIGRLCNLLT